MDDTVLSFKEALIPALVVVVFFILVVARRQRKRGGYNQAELETLNRRRNHVARKDDERQDFDVDDGDGGD